MKVYQGKIKTICNFSTFHYGPIDTFDYGKYTKVILINPTSHGGRHKVPPLVFIVNNFMIHAAQILFDFYNNLFDAF